MSAHAIEKVQSFVFFDTETTGLGINETSPTKITELAFVACLRDHLLDANKNDIPRALFKLVVPINPRKLILPQTTDITGLDNYMLERFNKMNENTIGLISSFLKQMPEPVCLVAHNGNDFDFKLLKRTLKEYNVTLQYDLLYVDSLDLFRKMDQAPIESVTSIGAGEGVSIIQKQNETTPSKTTAPRTLVSDGPPSKKPAAARRLFVEPGGKIEPPQTPVKSRYNQSYKLTEIYKRLFQTAPAKAHNAEDDVVTLLKCAIATKAQFVTITDSMCDYYRNY